MSAKPKCPKCGTPLNVWNLWAREQLLRPMRVACHDSGCNWSRVIKSGEILRLATTKPETCKWRDSAQPIGCLLTNKHESTPKFCSGCGKPVEVVDA